MNIPIKQKDLLLYLSKIGWTKVKSNRSALDIFVEPNNESPFEILLPTKHDSLGHAEYIRDAIKVLAKVEERDETQIIKSIRSMDSDLHNYRIDSKSSEFVSINLLHKLLSSSRSLLKGAARIEHAKIYDQMPISEKKKATTPGVESNRFIQDCNFAHTWKGSFGVTIEAPLWLPSMGLFEELPETLGRKTSKRIISDYKIISDAVEKRSFNYILDKIDAEDDILIFAQFPQIRDSLMKQEIEFSIALSPSIRSDENFNRISRAIINQTTLNYIEKAVEQIRVPSSELEIEIVGFPETISASKQDLLQDLLDADRKVTVKGISRQINYAALRMDLSLDDYKKAIRSQDEVKNVLVKCNVRRKIKGWEVTKVISFELLD